LSNEAEEAGSAGHEPAPAPVLFETRGGVALITLNRPRYGNAQNKRLLYDLDIAFMRAVDDDEVGAIILRGAGKHFSSGHDLGTPERDADTSNMMRRTPWYAEEGRPGAERGYVREQEIYLGLCRRWRDLPKPTIAAIHGACIAGGLMLAWVCDLIVASDDAYFVDPVVDMGVPGAEYFAHNYELPPRIAREFLMLGEKMTATRAYELGMVNRLVTREQLDDAAFDIAARLAGKPRFAMALTKQAFNFVDDIQGKRNAMEGVFGMHHLAHAHNTALHGSVIIPKRTPKDKE
jgi:enoyl-CoA hydratase